MNKCKSKGYMSEDAACLNPTHVCPTDLVAHVKKKPEALQWLASHCLKGKLQQDGIGKGRGLGQGAKAGPTVML